MTKETFYFQHDYNSRNDQKILMIRDKFNLEGYALFWMCLEAMAEEIDGYIYNKSIGGLSISFGIPKKNLQKLIDYCVNIGLFIRDKKGVYSERMKEHKNLRKLLSSSGKAGARIRWNNKRANSPPINPPNAGAYAKERKGKERKEYINSGQSAKNFNSIGDLLKTKNKEKKPPTYQWQEKALKAIEILKAPKNKNSSIFKCFKENTIKAQTALNDCKELNKLHHNYFFKVYNELCKKQK